MIKRHSFCPLIHNILNYHLQTNKIEIKKPPIGGFFILAEATI